MIELRAMERLKKLIPTCQHLFANFSIELAVKTVWHLIPYPMSHEFCLAVLCSLLPVVCGTTLCLQDEALPTSCMQINWRWPCV